MKGSSGATQASKPFAVYCWNAERRTRKLWDCYAERARAEDIVAHLRKYGIDAELETPPDEQGTGSEQD